MDYKTIVNRVLDRIDEPNISDVASASLGTTPKLVTQFVNETLCEIFAWSTQWRWREVESTATLVPGTTTYDLTDEFTIVGQGSATRVMPDTIKVVKIGSTPLTFVDKNFADLHGDLVTATSTTDNPYYTIFNNELRLFSNPLNGGTLKITHQLKPTELTTNSDTPTIPEEYHFAVVSGTEWRIKQFYGWPDTANVKSQYDDWLRKMLRYNKDYYQADYYVSLDPNFNVDHTRG